MRTPKHIQNTHLFRAFGTKTKRGIRNKGCIEKAVAKSNVRKLRHPRVIPQVGHGSPTISYKGHLKIPERNMTPKMISQIHRLFMV